MSFYASFAEHYDQVFPAGPKPGFVAGQIPSPARLLDVGCATGGVALALAQRGYQVLGVDLDDSLLRYACAKLPEAPTDRLGFMKADMRRLALPSPSFDGALCLGNTLVHLLSETDRRQALVMLKGLVRPGGSLLVQIVNYDRILAKGISSLPLIENERLRFFRTYSDVTPEKLRFCVRLELKATDQVFEAEQQLVPLRRDQLDHELRRAGWRPRAWWGGYGGADWSPDGFGCMVLADSAR